MSVERVVVGVERSTEGAAAVRFALAEAARRGVPLVAVRVWTDAVTTGYSLGMVLVAGDEIAQDARRVIEEMVKEASADVPGADAVDVDVRAVRGATGRVLVETADDASLLVVGTRSAGAVSRAVLGSVSQHVLHHAHCPVVVVPVPQDGDGSDPRVVVGIDPGSSTAAQAWAASAAAARGVALVPVEVPEPEPVGPALVAAARPQDVLVVGSRGRRAAVAALLGSTSSYAVRHAHCPVVVVREGAY